MADSGLVNSRVEEEVYEACRMGLREADEGIGDFVGGMILELVMETLPGSVGELAEVVEEALGDEAECVDGGTEGVVEELMARLPVKELVGLGESEAGQALVAARASANRNVEELVGCAGMAVLPSDGEWHPILIQSVDPSGEAPRVEITFVEFGGSNIVDLADVRLESELLVSPKAAGVCPMCERKLPLTFHHLIPRTTHGKYLREGYSVDELNKGVDLCRPCHSAVHRAEDEKTLGAEWRTLDALLTHPAIIKWIAYARKLSTRRFPGMTEVEKNYALQISKKQ